MTNRKDLFAGLLLIAVGGYFSIEAWLHLRLGTALRMGPGYFPFCVGLIVCVLGAVNAAGALRKRDEPFGLVPWRAMLLIASAPVTFGLTVRGAGLVPALMLSVFSAAYASKRMKGFMALALACGLTLFCFVVFEVALGLPLKAFGPWLVRD